MKYRSGALLGLVLSGMLAVSPAALAASRTEGPAADITESATESSTEGLIEAAAQGGEAISEVIADGYETSLEIEAMAPLQDAISDAAKGTDMSWLKSASFSGASVGNEDGGIDASGVISLNGTELYHGAVSVDPEEKKIYISCPEFRKKAAFVDLGRFVGKAGEGTGTSGEKEGAEEEDTSEKTGDFKKDYTRLLGEGKDFFSTVSAEDWKKFIGRYSDVFMNSAEFSEHKDVPMTAGPFSASVDNTTVTVSQEAVASILSSSVETLKTDPLILRVLSDDFASDLVNTVLAEAGSDERVSADILTGGYEDLLEKLGKNGFSGLPGFSLTYGFDEEGDPAYADLTVLYSGASIGVFSLKRLSREEHTAIEFDLGALVSSVAAGQLGGDPNGMTGFLLETDNQGGFANDTFTLTAAGTELFAVTLSDIDLAALGRGALTGTAHLEVGGMTFDAVFEHPETGTEVITGSYNGTEYFTVTAKADASDHVKVQKINRKKALEVYDQSTWDSYIKDASLSKMLRKLTDAGVPDGIVESLTSGEAATEPSRENTEEKNGAAEPQNGEVGGADIGHEKE